MIKVKIGTSPKEVEFGLLKADDVFIYQKKTFMRVLNTGEYFCSLSTARIKTIKEMQFELDALVHKFVDEVL